MADSLFDPPKSISVQSQSIAARFMNRFVIDEDDQFEIAAFQSVAEIKESEWLDKLDKAMQAVENLTKKQNQGLG